MGYMCLRSNEGNHFSCSMGGNNTIFLLSVIRVISIQKTFNYLFLGDIRQPWGLGLCIITYYIWCKPGSNKLYGFILRFVDIFFRTDELHISEALCGNAMKQVSHLQLALRNKSAIQSTRCIAVNLPQF